MSNGNMTSFIVPKGEWLAQAKVKMADDSGIEKLEFFSSSQVKFSPDIHQEVDSDDEDKFVVNTSGMQGAYHVSEIKVFMHEEKLSGLCFMFEYFHPNNEYLKKLIKLSHSSDRA